MLLRVFLAAGIVAASVASASAMSMSFSWGPTKKCFDSKSPPISMRGVPKGTAKLRFRMIDQDAPNYPHGGGTVKWTGKGSLPYGAFRYKGPCPPRPHTYQITVEALDKSNKVLAKARAKRRFP